jgi:hypothetical protein
MDICYTIFLTRYKADRSIPPPAYQEFSPMIEMGSKRESSAVSNSDREESASEPPAKRQRKQPSASKSKRIEPRIDVTYGQRSAFPGLDDSLALEDDDVQFEDEGDALEYLRSVR